MTREQRGDKSRLVWPQDFDVLERLGVDGVPERSHPYPTDDVVTYIPGLDYRPGTRQ